MLLMSRRLKRKEDLREGLQRISEKRLQDMLQLMSQVGLTAERVYDARKVIKSLRAILRLTAEALPIEVRKTRNQALPDLADHRKIGVEMRCGVFSEIEAESEEREGLSGGGANDGYVFTIGSVKTRAWGKSPAWQIARECQALITDSPPLA
jgi:hypothetical protein